MKDLWRAPKLAVFTSLFLSSWASLMAQVGGESCLQYRIPRFNYWVGKIRWKWDRLPTPALQGFLCGSAGKEPACNVGDLDLIPGLGRSPGGGHGNPLQYSCLENPRGLRSQAGYSPGGCKQSDKTERPSACNKSTPYPKEYLMIRMCNAISDLSCYIVVIYKTWTPEHAILANLLSPHRALQSIE